MDTPERSKNNQTANKFEDSPVFDFLNSLSPIKPVKSIPITQTINPLTFASLPSVFSSPHVSSLKECRFLRRNQLSDPSKPEFSSEDGIKNKVNVDANKKTDDEKENLDPTASDCELTSYECSKIIVEFSENLKYNHNIPNSNLTRLKPKHAPECDSNSSQLVPSCDSYNRSEVNIEEVSHIDQNKQGTSACGWEDLISDPSDLLIFESPNDMTESHKNPVDPAMSFYTSIKHAIQNSLSRGPMVSEKLFAQPGEKNETLDAIVGSSISRNPCENVDYQHLSGLYRGMRRRCLVFERAGSRLKHLADNSSSDSSMLRQSNENISSNQQQFLTQQTSNDSSQRVLPGIGLHLNALATTPKDYNVANHDASASRTLLIGPGSFANFHHPPSSGQELLGSTLAGYSLEREIDNVGNGGPPLEGSCRESGYVENEEINPTSPKKKRRRSEQAGEGDAACKRCNCKKSKCLKLYCECFAAGVYCVEPCACIDCFNKPVHEDTVLATRKQIESRNPIAFAPKVIRRSDSLSEIGDDSSKTPASARHKRGCNCKKGCLKKYCECYQGGVGCYINCRCEECKNAFGRKGGSSVLSTGHEYEEDETNTTEKAKPNRSFRKTTIQQDNPDQSMDSALPATPLRTGRQLVQPFSSKKKSPTSSFPSISSSTFSASQVFGKSSFFPPPPKFSRLSEPVEEDEMPDFLLEGSPNSGIKSLSPNKKRVSPPQRRGRSPGLRSSRKLILQSIPSFPSLTHNQ